MKKSAFNVAGNLVMGVKFMFQILSKIQDTSAREVARSHSSCILSFDLIGLHQNKRFYVTEIILPLGFADAIFRRERNDDRKCVCGSQARGSHVARLNFKTSRVGVYYYASRRCRKLNENSLSLSEF